MILSAMVELEQYNRCGGGAKAPAKKKGCGFTSKCASLVKEQCFRISWAIQTCLGKLGEIGGKKTNVSLGVHNVKLMVISHVQITRLKTHGLF